MDKQQEETLKRIYEEVKVHLYDDFKDHQKCQLIWEIYEMLHKYLNRKKLADYL